MNVLSNSLVRTLVILAGQDPRGKSNDKYLDGFEDGRLDLAREILNDMGIKYKETEAEIEEKLITKLLHLGLRKYPFMKKPSTGVNRFIDPRDNAIYITYTTGYVRRERIAKGRFSRGDRHQAPINKVKKTLRSKEYQSYYCETIMLYTEVERLTLLVEYMERKNRKVAKELGKINDKPVQNSPYRRIGSIFGY